MEEVFRYAAMLGPFVFMEPLPGSDETIGLAPEGTIATINGVRVKLLGDVKVEAGPNFELFSDGAIKRIKDSPTV